MTLSAHDNERLTQVGQGTPMGDLLRRYWWPIAGASEVDAGATRPVRLLGEDLVLYRDRRGTYGLIDRRCAHRGADLVHGVVEDCGVRCAYHGWRYDERGVCVEQPYDNLVHPGVASERVRITAYPVQETAGVVFAYLGPEPAPCLPDWDRYHARGFKQIAITELPCNWLQSQENAIDPLHFEWLHLNWSRAMRGEPGRAPRHIKLGFDEFEHGFVYRRVLEGGSEADESWRIGRVCLWPNCLFAGIFDWSVPIDDASTLRIVWHITPMPGTRPVEQERIPCWHAPATHADTGRWRTARFNNQDFTIIASQGRIADRTREHLTEGDRGIILMRRRFLADLQVVAGGGDPKGVVRDPAHNRRIALPLMSDQTIVSPDLRLPELEGMPDDIIEQMTAAWNAHRA